jgi:hypothetical protein
MATASRRGFLAALAGLVVAPFVPRSKPLFKGYDVFHFNNAEYWVPRITQRKMMARVRLTQEAVDTYDEQQQTHRHAFSVPVWQPDGRVVVHRFNGPAG